MTTEPAYLTLQSGTSRYLTKAEGTNYYLTLNDPAPYANDVDLLLAEAAWYIDAHDSNYSGGQSVPNMGTAGTALNAQMGSGTAVDTNDPKWLAYSAADGAYAYLPGTGASFLSTPDAAALDITGDIDIRVKVALDSWTTNGDLVAKWDVAGQASYSLVITSGAPRLYWTTDGNTSTFALATSAVSYTAGEIGWVRATLDVDNGAGGYSAKFYTSPDGTTWTQLGSTVTVAGVTSIFSGTSGLRILGPNTVGSTPGKFYRAIVKNGIDGTTVLDVDTSVLTSGSQTSFTATTGQTVTVSRSTSGRKTTLVGGWAGGGSLWLFGTDDYMEVPDNDAIDFGASDSFTVLAVVRQWDVASLQSLVFKMFTFGSTGWAVYANSSQGVSRIDDGLVDITATTATRTAGALGAIVSARSVTADTITTYLDGVAGTPTNDTVTATLSNSDPLRVGSISGGGFNADMEFTAAAIWRRALTEGEIDGLNRYFQNRAYNG